MPAIRTATAADAAAIAELMHARHLQYAAYQPTFWRVAQDARASHLAYLREVLERPNTIALLAQRADGSLAGALIAAVVPSPSVYAPGGPTCAIDDYWVADPRDWTTTGRALLAAATRQAKTRFGAAQAVVVCAQRDLSKRGMLAAEDYSVASEWWTKPL